MKIIGFADVKKNSLAKEVNAYFFSLILDQKKSNKKISLQILRFAKKILSIYYI